MSRAPRDADEAVRLLAKALLALAGLIFVAGFLIGWAGGGQ